jgi:nitrogen fixation/metabolism regulation signal transduction histidine kinase
MSKRKKYIIDKPFQLKTAFSIIGVVLLISLIILSSIAVSVVYNNEKVNNVYKIEDSIFQMMQAANIDNNMDEGYKIVIDNLTNLHNNNYNTIIKIAEYNKYLLIALIITVIIQGIVLFVMIIKITHRISGPIYVMSNYFKEIIAGNLPVPRPLRDKDELKEFYNLFVILVDSLKNGNKE